MRRFAWRRSRWAEADQSLIVNCGSLFSGACDSCLSARNRKRETGARVFQPFNVALLAPNSFRSWLEPPAKQQAAVSIGANHSLHVSRQSDVGFDVVVIISLASATFRRGGRGGLVILAACLSHCSFSQAASASGLRRSYIFAPEFASASTSDSGLRLSGWGASPSCQSMIAAVSAVPPCMPSSA